MRDLTNSLDVRRAISPAAAITDNTAVVSQIINLAGYDSCMLAINLGSLADADATFAVTAEHGNDSGLSDTAAVPATGLTGTTTLAGFDFSADNATRKIGYVGGKQYVRFTITPSANSGNAFISAVAILGNSRYRSTPNPPSGT